MTEPKPTADNAAQTELAQAITALVEALKQDAEQRNQAMLQMNDYMDKRNARLHLRMAERTRRETDQQIAVEQQRNKRANWYTLMLGLFAVLFGGVMFYMVLNMTRDMNRMEDYMYNMGHTADDTRIRGHERKIVGVSFMNSMADDMQTMGSDMATMSREITAMSADMRAMRVAMLNMDDSMGSMTGDIARMSTEITTMNGTMGRMQFDTLLMRQGVGSMSNDTRAMGAPFRTMNSFIPW